MVCILVGHRSRIPKIKAVEQKMSKPAKNGMGGRGEGRGKEGYSNE